MIYTRSHTQYIFGVVLAITILFFGMTMPTHAYFTTNQETIDLGNGSGLFLIDYVFGMSKREVDLPTIAYNTDTKTHDSVSYEILDADNKPVKGKATGVILSDADMSTDAMYITRKGQAKKMTLAVVFTPETPGVGRYRLHVTHLPFQFDKTVKLQLNPSELTYYKTSLLKL